MRKRKVTCIVTAVVLAMSTLLSGCGSKKAESASDVIYIGTSFPMSGSVAGETIV